MRRPGILLLLLLVTVVVVLSVQVNQARMLGGDGTDAPGRIDVAAGEAGARTTLSSIGSQVHALSMLGGGLERGDLQAAVVGTGASVSGSEQAGWRITAPYSSGEGARYCTLWVASGEVEC